ncbi:tRNA ligase subunit PheS family protein, partial [Bacillus pumilus]
LNLPNHHPPPHIHHTFYITHHTLLTTQTSPLQPRTLQKYKPQPPLNIISPPKLYTPHSHHPTHSHQFIHIEPLLLD